MSKERAVKDQSPPSSALKESWIISANGKRVYCCVALPDSASESHQCPAVLIVPGGLGSGTPYLSTDTSRRLLQDGYTLITFNPQGRGSGTPYDLKSEGNEDFNGYAHQDDLLSVFKETQNMQQIDPAQVGILSFSFGISMAAGCLARHPGLNPAFLIDIEGPSDSYVIMADPWRIGMETAPDITEILFNIFRHRSTAMDTSPENFRWWSEREAVRFVGSVKAPYMRLQAEWDHMQPPNEDFQKGFHQPPLWYQNKHAIDMLNAATQGSALWTRMNDALIGNRVNALYSHTAQPVYYKGQFDFDSPAFSDLILRSIQEISAEGTKAS